MTKIIALQACRHGIGCSHLVANLAVILMHRGYRVGLLDSDLQQGGVRTLFGVDQSPLQDLDAYWRLSPNTTSRTLQSHACRYDNANEAKEMGIYLPSQVNLLETQSKQFQHLQQRYGVKKPFNVVQRLSRELALDVLLIDNQPEMTDLNLMGLSLADISVVIMQLDTYDLQRTAVLLEVIQQLEISATWLVPTLVLPTIEHGVVKHMLENTYRYPVAGILYLSDDIASLASQGIFCLQYPNHVITQTMMAISHQLVQDSQTLSTSSRDRWQELL